MLPLITDPQTLARFARDTVYLGHPDFVHIAGDWQVVREVMREANAKKMPVTFCGSQTSMTGASVADSGIALSLQKQNRIHDLIPKEDGALLVCDPGVVLADVKKFAADNGYFYPPDPTSFNEALIGSTIATNATGEDTFKYGPTRWHVQALDVILADGTESVVGRNSPSPLFPRGGSEKKNTAGYFLDAGEIDEVIGSEGTLCLIKRVTLKLIKNLRPNIFVLVLPFSDFGKALRAVGMIAGEERAGQPRPYEMPRALELIGPGAAPYFAACPDCPSELKNEKCFLYVKDEFADEADFALRLDAWFQNLESIYKACDDKTSLARIFVAKTDAQLKAIHTCRHFIPLKVNEEYFFNPATGGGKVGTDWWVPLHHLSEMMQKTYDEASRLQIPFLVFGHIGNGHPHWNFLARDAREKQIAQEFVKRQCRDAVLYGGGVAGEHGIGKIKRELLAIQHAPKVIAKMRALKQKWDPNWILGRGNIFNK